MPLPLLLYCSDTPSAHASTSSEQVVIRMYETNFQSAWTEARRAAHQLRSPRKQNYLGDGGRRAQRVVINHARDTALRVEKSRGTCSAQVTPITIIACFEARFSSTVF
jgi:hypothetical protein